MRCCMLAVLMIACGVARPEEPGGAGGGAALPWATYESAPSNSTNVNAAAGLRFELGGVTADRLGSVATEVSSKAAFFDSSGVQVATATWTLSGQTLVLVPASPLAADAWYELRLAPGQYTLKSSTPLPGGVVRFFTGSAPRLHHLMRTAIAKGTTQYVTVVLSEPVTLGQLSGMGLELFDGAARVGGCVFREERCVVASETQRISAFDFRFDGALVSPPAVTRVTMAGTLTGGGRTFAQAASLHGDVMTADGRVTYQVGQWAPCGDDIECWAP